MYEKELKIECERGKYNVGDIIAINDEKWIVTTIHYGITDHITCQPLLNFIINTNYIKLEGEPTPFRLADYINDLIAMYTIKRKCETNEQKS